jgi:hypothetical protein
MGVYRNEGVRRLQHEHHVPALIGQEDLLKAVRLANLSFAGFLNNARGSPPLLTFPPGFQLKCLHGKHRIEAAKLSACLQGQDRWWTVTLYSEGMPSAAQRSSTQIS